MRHVRTIVLVPLLAIGFSGCLGPETTLPEIDQAAVDRELAHQREAFLQSNRTTQERLHAIAFRILKAGAQIYPRDKRFVTGVMLSSEDSFDAPYRLAANLIFSLDNQLTVMSVAPKSPAESAGIQPGDRIVGLNGSDMSSLTGPAALKQLQDALKPGDSIKLDLDRGGNILEKPVTPVPIADYQVKVAFSAEINALATGSTIEVNRGMIEFCRNDAELAFIVAHELAHNALKHHRKVVLNYLAGTAIDLALIAAHIPSVNAVGLFYGFEPSTEFEAEADYVALILMDEAGFDLEAVRNIWRRFALLAPERKSKRPTIWTHPDPAERHVRLSAAIDLIKAQHLD